MGKYCCFFDPQKDYTEKLLSDCCPCCGKSYDYVLKNKPSKIVNNGQEYTVLEAIGRGFYGATYLCEIQKRFKKERVLLKVIPVSLYDFFNKNFEEECQKHAEVSENTEHLVKINDAFDADILFGSDQILCHVAELQYLQGKELSDYIEDDENIQPKIFAQITIDLLKMWNELVLKQEFHNDLHMGNLIVEELEDSIQRVDAIYDKIRLVAIDLNSIGDESLSNSAGVRIGDRRHIANHITVMINKLRQKHANIDEFSDTDFRLMETLKKISNFLSITPSAIDVPNISELIDMIKEEFRSNISYSPWKRTLSLSKFNDGINAQTLPSCYVPKLLVDPDNKWIDEVSKLGPQLITGMRGCGKTMLLGALDIHARLEVNKNVLLENNGVSACVKDRFIGITASCRELIEVSDIKTHGIAKLILLYSVQIIRALRHLYDINASYVKKGYHFELAKSLSKIFDIEFPNNILYSDTIFEKHLADLANRINSFCKQYSMKVSIITAFEILADNLISSSDIWAGKQVYFLLDDASTRYLSVDKISQLLTNVLFMSQKSAFKITTELQTLYSFKSPGNVEMAQDIRDYQIFDLGADVFNRTRDPQQGKTFIESIIQKRLEVCPVLQGIPASLYTVLGDCSLQDIARYIITHPSGKDRKVVYHGATALAALCVGDIGDTIFLYDSIISSNTTGNYPVSPKIQHQCFQQLCSRRMYNLERKDSKLREYVKAFSEASYKCLMDSPKALTKEGTPSKRIRQYNSLYVRINEGDISKQQEQLRKLIDSGIFVFADGNGWPRSKSNDTDPITQLKLAFRKLFGVSNFIGLANADRFELSGSNLEEWLETPTKEILMRNLGKSDDDSATASVNEYNATDELLLTKELEKIVGENRQLTLFENIPETCDDAYSPTANMLDSNFTNRVKLISHKNVFERKVFDVGIFALGFEERCLESIKRITQNNQFTNIVLVKYKETGYSKEIIDVISNKSNVIIVDFDDLKKISMTINSANSILIDITGLYKPIIFETIRKSLLDSKKLSVIYTEAAEYYPLNCDIKKLIVGGDVDDATKFANLMNGLDTGDTGAYYNMSLLEKDNYDPMRPTALIGFVSPKNQRIFSVLDKIEYDSVVLFVPKGNSPRDKLSRTAGNIAMTNYPSVTLKEFDTKNPNKVLKAISECYSELYINNNCNLEISLTGSKMQAVISAAFSAACKISQCWYVKPSAFDTGHFTKGVGKTLCYTITISDN